MELVGHVANGLTRLFGRAVAAGVEHLPVRGPAVLAVNHTTIADVPPVLSTLYRAGLRPSEPCGHDECGVGHGHVRFMASSRVIDDALIGRLARQAGMIDVRTGNDAYGEARAALGRGEIVGIYPEGDALSPLPDGAPRKFRLGVGKLAVDTRAPVIPIAHHDAREIGSGSIGRTLAGALTAMVRRPTVRIQIGEAIPGDHFVSMTPREAADLVHERVTDLWRRLSTRM